MRVLIVGEAAPGALADSYAYGFRELGATVTRFCTRAGGAIPGTGSRVGRRIVAPIAARILNARVRGLANSRADLVLVIKGAELAPATVEALRDSGAPVVNFYPDDPFSTLRSNRLRHGAAVLGAYTHCFTFARHLMEGYRRAGADVSYLPFAWDPRLHTPQPADGEPLDAVFVGNLDAERVSWLEAVDPSRLTIFGEHTRAAVPPGSPLARARFFPALYGRDMAALLARSRISVNLMRMQNAASHNMRSWESPACGAFTLSQRTPELTELFREGEEVACFGTPAELAAAVDHWLGRPDDRARIAAAGLRRVAAESYTARASAILRTVGLAP
ncbi:MAG TPA: glycosyltransferase [Longimicrobium sp.]|nr:glycosyltransferase [Longimicrobium sp.]